MGNTAICKSTPCTTNPKPVYKTKLSEIFQITTDKRHDPSLSRTESSDSMNRRPSAYQVDVPRLDAHVKSHIKSLIDYLEGNHKQLIDTADYIYKRVMESYIPEVYMIALLVITELLIASSKFTHNPAFLAKLRQSGGKGVGTIKSEESSKEKKSKNMNKSRDSDGSFFEENNEKSLKDNIIHFENRVVEIFIHLLSKNNPFRESTFQQVLKTMDLYMSHHIKNMSSDKLETILDLSFEVIEIYPNLSNKEDLEIQILFTKVLTDILGKYQVSFKFKHKFISHSCNNLKGLYEMNQNDLVINQMSTENKNLVQELSRYSFLLIETVNKIVLDNKEFGGLIAPLLIFFDSIQWKNTQDQTTIFLSLIESMKSTPFDQVELFLIDKIVEYLDNNKYNQNNLVNPFKHNDKVEVKIRVFSLLTTIFENTKRTFLSFMVIDNITQMFVNNLKYIHLSDTDSQRDQLRYAINGCQKKFIEKLETSSINLNQLINSIATQFFLIGFKDNRNDILVSEISKFFDFTVQNIPVFPSLSNISKESLLIFIRIRVDRGLFPKTHRPIQELLNLKYEAEDQIAVRGGVSQLKKKDFLICPPDVAFTILSSNLTSLIEIGKERDTLTNDELANFINFVKHCTWVNESLLMRHNSSLLAIVLAFMKKIMALSSRENIPKQYRGLLYYILFSFFKRLQNSSWSVPSLAPKVSRLEQTLPLEAFQALDTSGEIDKNEAWRIFELLEKAYYAPAETQHQEFEAILNLMANDLKTAHSNFEDLNEDFDNLGSIFAVKKTFLNVGDVEISFEHNKSLVIEEVQLSKNPSTHAKQQNKANNSLTNLQLVNHQNVINSYNKISRYEESTPNNQSSQYMDQSFEQALKETKKNKENTTNLSKILNGQF